MIQKHPQRINKEWKKTDRTIEKKNSPIKQRKGKKSIHLTHYHTKQERLTKMYKINISNKQNVTGRTRKNSTYNIFHTESK